MAKPKNPPAEPTAEPTADAAREAELERQRMVVEAVELANATELPALGGPDLPAAEADE